MRISKLEKTLSYKELELLKELNRMCLSIVEKEKDVPPSMP
jgi:hypothetical protein